MRQFVEERGDYRRIRSFLQRVFWENGRREFSWQAARLDYWVWHVVANLEESRLAEDVFIWETSGGEIAAVLNPEGGAQVYLQVDPRRRDRQLEEEMITIAESRLARPGADGRPRLFIHAHEQDDLRRSILESRGYVPAPGVEYQRRRELQPPLPEPDETQGYEIRPLGGPAELPARSWASWRAFHPDAPDREYEGWEWYRNVQRAPLYRPDLDLVAAAPDGAIAAFCTIWYDPETRSGYFEPVGVVPEHQRRGLGKAILQNGLIHLHAAGGEIATVAGFSRAANRLYAAVFGEPAEQLIPWIKYL